MLRLDDDKIYGFAFGEELSDINFDDIHKNLMDKYGVVNNIVLSLHKDDFVWVVAADKHLSGEKINTIVRYIEDKDILYDYILTDDAL